MTNLKRLVAICILTVSSFGVALADGGETQGVPGAVPPPPTECTANCSSTATTSPAQNPSVDIVSVTAILVTWLAQSIL